MSTTQRKTLSVDGMHCEHCVDVVREALEDLEGVTVQDIEVGSVEVSLDSASVSEATISSTLEEAGYSLAALL